MEARDSENAEIKKKLEIMEAQHRDKDGVLSDKKSKIEELNQQVYNQNAVIEGYKKEFEEKKIRQAHEIMKDSQIFQLQREKEELVGALDCMKMQVDRQKY